MTDERFEALKDAYIRGATWYRKNEDFGGLLHKAAYDYADAHSPPGTTPPPFSLSSGWQDMASSPKDGTILRLLVVPDGDEFTPFDDSMNPYETIGFNNLADTTEDRWEFAGWDWSQDCFITGRGEVIGWCLFTEDRPDHIKAADEIEILRAGIKRLSDEEELCAETTGEDPFSMVYLAAKLAAVETVVNNISSINVDKIAKAIVLAACELDEQPDPDDDDTLTITVQDLEAVAYRHITVAIEHSALASEGSDNASS